MSTGYSAGLSLPTSPNFRPIYSYDSHVELVPQPLRSRRDPFVDNDYLFELKLDGFRALAQVEDGRCELFSHSGAKFSGFRFLAGDIASSIPLTKRALLDGEIVCLDENGYPQFNDLLFHRGEPCFFAFDVLSLEGYDLRSNALIEARLS